MKKPRKTAKNREVRSEIPRAAPKLTESKNGHLPGKPHGVADVVLVLQGFYQVVWYVFVVAFLGSAFV